MGKRVITRREAAMIHWQIGGFEFSLNDLVRLSGIPVDPLQQRLMRGWDAERAVMVPVRTSLAVRAAHAQRWTRPVRLEERPRL